MERNSKKIITGHFKNSFTHKIVDMWNELDEAAILDLCIHCSPRPGHKATQPPAATFSMPAQSSLLPSFRCDCDFTHHAPHQPGQGDSNCHTHLSKIYRGDQILVGLEPMPAMAATQTDSPLPLSCEAVL
ncbi:hypothetical protein E2C01_026920 [Portunus trituberculatus]|uniref:Uncharacterized protein n=1 Tax=Portunus trituberculatus TaxID=210409 RepID=A0A5B7EJH2_PORTR|nr:hypothetical protein [Portunus trituberculatus]